MRIAGSKVRVWGIEGFVMSLVVKTSPVEEPLLDLEVWVERGESRSFRQMGTIKLFDVREDEIEILPEE